MYRVTVKNIPDNTNISVSAGTAAAPETSKLVKFVLKLFIGFNNFKNDIDVLFKFDINVLKLVLF